MTCYTYKGYLIEQITHGYGSHYTWTFKCTDPSMRVTGHSLQECIDKIDLVLEGVQT